MTLKRSIIYGIIRISKDISWNRLGLKVQIRLQAAFGLIFALSIFQLYTSLLYYTAYFNTYLSDLTFAYNANLVTAHNNLICAVTNAVLIDLRSS